MSIKLIDLGCGHHQGQIHERPETCWTKGGLAKFVDEFYPGEEIDVLGVDTKSPSMPNMEEPQITFEGTTAEYMKDRNDRVHGVIWRYADAFDILNYDEGRELKPNNLVDLMTLLVSRNLLPGGYLFFETHLPTMETQRSSLYCRYGYVEGFMPEALDHIKRAMQSVGLVSTDQEFKPGDRRRVGSKMMYEYRMEGDIYVKPTVTGFHTSNHPATS
jgi:hypothetical protein